MEKMNTKRVQHDERATGKSATPKECDTQKCNMKKVQYDKSAT